jgi:hypothetical protein
MLRVCCECVAKILRTWLLETSNIRSFSSLLPRAVTILRLYCGHAATDVACDIQHQEPLLPSPRHNTQHQMSATSNATSATLKNNVCNNQQQMSTTPRLNICNIEIDGCNIQHQRAYPLDATHNMSTTSKLNIRDI